MCRQNQLWGFLTLAFGLGVLVGLWLESGFFQYCFALGTLLAGVNMVRKK